jgi:hypothetical protein
MGNDRRSNLGELEKQGWVRQFVASEPRLSEAAALYGELGFDVHLEPIRKGQDCDTCSGTEEHKDKGECRVCFDGFEDQYKILFTRRRKNPHPSEKEDLR